jgi:hypothetical protein
MEPCDKARKIRKAFYRIMQAGKPAWPVLFSSFVNQFSDCVARLLSDEAILRLKLFFTNGY